MQSAPGSISSYLHVLVLAWFLLTWAFLLVDFGLLRGYDTSISSVPSCLRLCFIPATFQPQFDGCSVRLSSSDLLRIVSLRGPDTSNLIIKSSTSVTLCLSGRTPILFFRFKQGRAQTNASVNSSSSLNPSSIPTYWILVSNMCGTWGMRYPISDLSSIVTLLKRDRQRGYPG